MDIVNITVLDRVPELAASYLTKRDATRYFSYLTNFFKNYGEKKKVKSWLICSKYNYNWFIRFYKTIADLIGKEVDIDSLPPYTSTPVRYGLFLNKRYVSKNNTIFNEIMEISKRKQASAVEFNRIYYMMQNYIASDFVTGQLPSWYSSRSSVLWEGRDPETMSRIRLEKDTMVGLIIKIETTYNNWKIAEITDPNAVKIIRALLQKFI